MKNVIIFCLTLIAVPQLIFGAPRQGRTLVQMNYNPNQGWYHPTPAPNGGYPTVPAAVAESHYQKTQWLGEKSSIFNQPNIKSLATPQVIDHLNDRLSELGNWQLTLPFQRVSLDIIERYSIDAPKVTAMVEASNDPRYRSVQSSIMEAGFTELDRMVEYTAGHPGEEATLAAHQRLADTLLDYALSLTPGVSEIRDIYEFVSGKDMLTGRVLTTAERASNLLGILSMGASNPAKVGMRAAAEITTAARKGAHIPVMREGYQQAMVAANRVVCKAGSVLKGWRSEKKIVTIHDAATINVRFGEAPYRAGTKVIEFINKKEEKFVRVHREENRLGGWMMKKEGIKGLTPSQIKSKYQLEHTPTHITDVSVPPDTTIHRGKVASVDWKKDRAPGDKSPEGAIQYHLQERISVDRYTNTRPL